MWTFAPWVQDELDAVMEELAGMPKPTIGFHIRGGDKLSEDVQLVRQQGLLQLVTWQWPSSTCLIYDHLLWRSCLQPCCPCRRG